MLAAGARHDGDGEVIPGLVVATDCAARLRPMAFEIQGVEGMQSVLGQKIGPSEWRTVSQADIDAFAELSGDDQWIHVDVERAKAESPFGTTIAHGNLTLSLVDGFRKELITASGFALGVNYGWNKIRSRLRSRSTAKRPRQRRGRLRRRDRRRLVAGGDPLHPRGRGQREAVLRGRLGDPCDGARRLTRVAPLPARALDSAAGRRVRAAPQDPGGEK